MKSNKESSIMNNKNFILPELNYHQRKEFIFTHLLNINLLKEGRININVPDKKYYSNEKFWNDIIKENTRALSVIELINFQVIDWYPRSPGLYHTNLALYHRLSASSHYVAKDNAYFYNPHGKANMIEGGIGSVRFKSIKIEGIDSWLCTATSDGYCHTGIPVAIPLVIMEKINFNFITSFNLIGQIRFLPDFLSSFFSHQIKIPQIYIIIKKIERVKTGLHDIKNKTMIFFKTELEKWNRQNGNVTYVTCNSNNKYVEKAVEWMAKYITMYKGEALTNFDQQRLAFSNVPFSLQNIMSGQINEENLMKLNIENAKIICNNVNNIARINKAKINSSIKGGIKIMNVNKKNNPWISGSFYLTVVAILLTIFMIIAKMVHIGILPIVILGTLLLTSLIGAFQLRNDDSISEKNFLKLMILTFRYIPFLGKRKKINDSK